MPKKSLMKTINLTERKGWNNARNKRGINERSRKGEV
jgi:hypothetical protein